MQIDLIKENDQNPRLIKEDAFNKLVESIKEDPQMLEARPLVIDENNVVLGGNMRLKALKHLEYKDVPVYKVEGWTEEQKRRFIIKDNLSGGQWDYDILTSEYDAEELSDWGMENLDKYLIEDSEELIAEPTDKPLTIQISFKDRDELYEAKVEIEGILGKYNANLSVSGGEL